MSLTDQYGSHSPDPFPGSTPGPERGMAAADIAAYSEELLREMEVLAARNGLERLRDLLCLAKEEARREVHRNRG